MKRLCDIITKPGLNVIGLMSGTSADGVDAALVRVDGCGLQTRVRQFAFVSIPFESAVRERILALATGDAGGSRELCRMSFLLGRLFVAACEAVCEKAKFSKDDVDLIGSHGQTLWHIPREENYLGVGLTGTLQIGEVSLLNEAFGCPVVSDFRVRDMASGGQGAPLVPYTEYILYRSDRETVALQNLGGIGNITLLPKGGTLNDTIAFDTGPGNMVIDELTYRITRGTQTYDDNGTLATRGKPNEALLRFLMNDEYLSLAPPKTTGRERYGAMYVDAIQREAQRLGVSELDQLATATRSTAECIREGVERFCRPKPDRLIVSGGGSRNVTLMAYIKRALPDTRVMTSEDMGLDSDAKEAVAFAILANECVRGLCNNAPGATGAKHPAVLGKISQY